MNRLILIISSFVIAAASSFAAIPSPTYSENAVSSLGDTLKQIETGILAQRQAGHPDYNPELVYVVDPKTQRMHVVSRKTSDIVLTLLCGTGSAGVGFGSRQTPHGFFTMGGIRIAKNASQYIQTGDTKTGVSGIYAEILYPPSHSYAKLRGRVPNNVVIHSFNPTVSEMLRQRQAYGLIGKRPCTTGCPVTATHESIQLVPFLKQSAGKFDPTSRPNKALRKLIATRQVVEYSSQGLGAAIFIINPG